MMSPIYHPAMKIVRPIRKKLRVKTVFNILGPMLNPARVNYAVVGVYTEDLVSISFLVVLPETSSTCFCFMWFVSFCKAANTFSVGF